MAAFRQLKESCMKFEETLHQQASTLLSAKSLDISEDIRNKLQEISIYSSKSCLLNAKLKAVTPQITDRVHDPKATLNDYEEAVKVKILEMAVAKSQKQCTVLKKLITTPDEELSGDQLERKENIMQLMRTLQKDERELDALDKRLTETEEVQLRAMEDWYEELGKIKHNCATFTTSEIDTTGPIYHKLLDRVKKMELMRWLVGKLILGRVGYDWMSDKYNMLDKLELTRAENSVEDFLES